MKFNVSIIFIIIIIFTGCYKAKVETRNDGEVQVRCDNAIQNAIIYINGEKKAMTGDDYTTIVLKEGNYEVRIYKEKNKEWFYDGTKKIFVGANSSVKVTINIDIKPTKFRLKKLAEEKLAEEKKLLIKKKIEEKRLIEEKIEKLKIAKKYGLSAYPNDIYIDTDTDLMWQDNKDAKSIKKKWNNAKIYCKNLSIGKYNDWRLPSYNELLTIVDYKKVNPAIKDGFKHVESFLYWSSSWRVKDSTYAWHINFESGRTSVYSLHSSLHIRCVRGK